MRRAGSSIAVLIGLVFEVSPARWMSGKPRQKGPRVPVPRPALGRLLQERRMQQGYSRARVAEAVGISAGTIEGWEIGRVAKPPLHDVLRLARFLSVPLDDLEGAALADEGEAGQHERKNAAV